uniref:Uncharacterized protein n=1 Tax=Timema monikensis TaxID=170555 RepID=A0A7R9HUS2_9NEOP|nr:unnamed protein product [Timema monikensis]
MDQNFPKNFVLNCSHVWMLWRSNDHLKGGDVTHQVELSVDKSTTGDVGLLGQPILTCLYSYSNVPPTLATEAPAVRSCVAGLRPAHMLFAPEIHESAVSPPTSPEMVRYSLVWGANSFCEALLTLHGLCPLSVVMHTTCTAGNSVTDDHVAPTPSLVSFSQREDLALPYSRVDHCSDPEERGNILTSNAEEASYMLLGLTGSRGVGDPRQMEAFRSWVGNRSILLQFSVNRTRKLQGHGKASLSCIITLWYSL